MGVERGSAGVRNASRIRGGLTPETPVHRIGGGNIANLRLKPAEEALPPPGFSVLLGGTPGDAAEQMRQAFPDPRKFARLHRLAEMVGTGTVAAIRAAGFDVLPNPSTKFPNHAGLISPDGVGGFSDANLERLAQAFSAHTDSREVAMSLRHEQPISLKDKQDRDLGRVVIERVEHDLVSAGSRRDRRIRRSSRLFAEYVDAANDQLLSTVAELDGRIGALGLRLQSADGAAAPAIYDVQIGDGVITFRTRSAAEGSPFPDTVPVTSLPGAELVPRHQRVERGLAAGSRSLQDSTPEP